jgi:tetratricopeptide (TPR) repeat protein
VLGPWTVLKGRRMPPKKNYYEMFKLYPPISMEQLQDAYKQLIFENHPDRNPHDVENAIERTMEIVEAYNVLSDPEKRETYNFQVRNDIRREIGEMVGVKRGLLKVMKSKEENEAEEKFQKGIAFFGEKDNWNQAQHEWVSALKLVPGFVNAHYNLGVLFGFQGNFKDSISCFERAVKFNPGDFEAKKTLSTVMGYVYGKKA